MKRAAIFSAGTLVVASTAFSFQVGDSLPRLFSGAETPSIEDVEASAVQPSREIRLPTLPERMIWHRPPGPMRVALQAGHWKSAEAPDEQAGLRGNGTRGGGKAEWEVNLKIAQLTAEILQEEGYEVTVLPTTIPPGYWADVFVSIHADGNSNANISGYRAAAPRRDRTGRAQALSDLLDRTYGEATGLRHYPTITRRMTGYYAFNSRRYQHSLHPMTTGVILETGFLTSPADRRVIVNTPERAANGIAAAVKEYLTTTALESIEVDPRVAPIVRSTPIYTD